MGVAPEGQPVGPAAATPLDPDTLFLPTGDALTDRFKNGQPRIYERYLRIRSTATRIEALRHPRKMAARSWDERGKLAECVPAITSPMLIVVGGLDRLHELVQASEYHVIEGSPQRLLRSCGPV